MVNRARSSARDLPRTGPADASAPRGRRGRPTETRCGWPPATGHPRTRGFVAATRTEEPNGRSRPREQPPVEPRHSRISSRSTTGETCGSVDHVGGQRAGARAERPASHPAGQPLGGEEREAPRRTRTSPARPRARRPPTARDQPRPGVAAVVPVVVVEVAPGPLVGGHRQQQPAARCEHPGELVERRCSSGSQCSSTSKAATTSKLPSRNGSRIAEPQTPAGLEAARVDVEGGVLAEAAQPAHARAVGAPDVEDPGRLTDVAAERGLQQRRAGRGTTSSRARRSRPIRHG